MLKKNHKERKENFSVEKKEVVGRAGKKKNHTFRSPQQHFVSDSRWKAREKEALKPRSRSLVLQIQGSYILLSEVEARRTLPASPTSHPPLTQAALSLSQTRQSLNSLL